MVPIYVMTCDKYLKTVRGFMHLFNKYWGWPATIVGFSAPEFDLPDNFSFLSLGPQEKFPVNRWSDSLIRLLSSIEHEHFILMLEDYWLVRQVDTAGVEALLSYVKSRPDIIRGDLTGDRLYAGQATFGGHVGHVDLVHSHHGSPYHLSLMTAIWNRDLLHSLLIPNESPWDVEIYGTSRLEKLPHLKVVGTRQWPVRHTLAHRGGDGDTYLLDELQGEDREYLRGNNLA